MEGELCTLIEEKATHSEHLTSLELISAFDRRLRDVQRRCTILPSTNHDFTPKLLAVCLYIRHRIAALWINRRPRSSHHLP